MCFAFSQVIYIFERRNNLLLTLNLFHMRKTTLSMLVLIVSVFFVSHLAFGQATKTADVIKYIPPVATDAVMTDTYSCDFEDLDDWAQEFTPWTVVDMDGLTTYTMTGVTWPGGGDPGRRPPPWWRGSPRGAG